MKSKATEIREWFERLRLYEYSDNQDAIDWLSVHREDVVACLKQAEEAEELRASNRIPTEMFDQLRNEYPSALSCILGLMAERDVLWKVQAELSEQKATLEARLHDLEGMVGMAEKALDSIEKCKKNCDRCRNKAEAILMAVRVRKELRQPGSHEQ